MIMIKGFPASLACVGFSLIAARAAAQDPAPPPLDAEQPAQADADQAPPKSTTDEAPAQEKKPEESGWQTSLSGYFRAPLMFGISRRQEPGGTPDQRSTQVVYAPNRLVDANYSSFGYTRLQESDWAEVYVTAKKDHVSATVAFMGYWYAWAGYEHGNAVWMPAQGWVTLDSDFRLGSLKPHVELKGGVFWQRWGMFEKYDTYLYGRFHQVGGALDLSANVTPDWKVSLTGGLGGNRNGSPDDGTGLTLMQYARAGLTFRKSADVGAYYSGTWTRDPTLFTGDDPVGGGPYVEAKAANMTVAGADVKLEQAPFGKLWAAFSYIDVDNGWALPQIVEVMHSPGAAGIAENYLGYGQPGSSGSGHMYNVAAEYDQSLNSLQGASEDKVPNLAWSLFGLMADSHRDLAPEATIPERLTQLKWGTDLTLTTLPWLAFVLRYDQVHLDLDDAGNTFHVLTPRVVFFSHVLSSESIWIQYSRYFYGSEIALPITDTQPYPTPDRNVVKLQANMSF
jgi:hypothetical protein